MDDAVVDRLGANTWFLIQELRCRGIDVQLIDESIDAISASFGGRRELLVSLHSRLVPHSMVRIVEDKYVLKTMLRRAGLAAVEGDRFMVDSSRGVYLYAAELGYPVVLKPCVGAGGDNVHLDLGSLPEVDQALDRFQRSTGGQQPFLIERQVEGAEYRVFITCRGEYAVVHRDPASVIGDGYRTILELASAESYLRTHPPNQNCLRAMVIDEPVHRHLAKSGRTLDTVPAQNEKVYLRRNSNVISGAMAEDVTEKTHPSVIEICKRTLDALDGLSYAGIDFITSDITAPQVPGRFFVLEVNTNPSVGIHARPGRGRGRNVVAPIVDMLFSETARGSPPPGALVALS